MCPLVCACLHRPSLNTPPSPAPPRRCGQTNTRTRPCCFSLLLRTPLAGFTRSPRKLSTAELNEETLRKGRNHCRFRVSLLRRGLPVVFCVRIVLGPIHWNTSYKDTETDLAFGSNCQIVAVPLENTLDNCSYAALRRISARHVVIRNPTAVRVASRHALSASRGRRG